MPADGAGEQLGAGHVGCPAPVEVSGPLTRHPEVNGLRVLETNAASAGRRLTGLRQDRDPTSPNPAAQSGCGTHTTPNTTAANLF